MSTNTNSVANNKAKKQLLALVECAIFAAIGFILTLKPFTFEAPWAYGGSVGFVMLPILIMSTRHGIVKGLVTGLIVGFLNWISDGFYAPHWGVPLLDYFAAFSIVGIGGIFHSIFKNASTGKQILRATLAGVVGGIVRFAIHFISGILLWGEFAPEGQAIPVYSFVYNIGFMLPSIVIVTIALSLLTLNKKTCKLLFNNKEKA